MMPYGPAQQPYTVEGQTLRDELPALILSRILSSANTVSLFHSAEEQLLDLQRDFHLHPKYPASTQPLHYCFTGEKSIRFEDCVERWLGIKIQKEDTDVDWTERNENGKLSDEQMCHSKRETRLLPLLCLKMLEGMNEPEDQENMKIQHLKLTSKEGIYQEMGKYLSRVRYQKIDIHPLSLIGLNQKEVLIYIGKLQTFFYLFYWRESVARRNDTKANRLLP
jgi:ribonuclease D